MRREVLRKAMLGSIGGLALLLAAQGGVAQEACNPRWPTVQFVRDDLQRASREGDLPSALDYADRARRGLEHLAKLSARCACPAAAGQFDEAARRLRPAQAADSRAKLREVVGGVRPLFDQGMERLVACGG